MVRSDRTICGAFFEVLTYMDQLYSGVTWALGRRSNLADRHLTRRLIREALYASITKCFDDKLVARCADPPFTEILLAATELTKLTCLKLKVPAR